MKPRKTKNVGGDWKDDAQRKPGKQNVAGGKQLDCDAREGLRRERACKLG
jgi:hypothetical protein